MAAEPSRAVGDGSAVDACMKLTCSHGGRLVPCGPDGARRYGGGETRVLVVPRYASFRDLAARFSEMASGAEVRAVRHRLADAGLENVIVSVTCDEELAHMRDEYDRLRATRPTARFRVFVDIATTGPASGGGVAHQLRAASGLPPLAPRMRRAQSDQALAVSAQRFHRRPAYPAAMRRVQSAQELARATRVQLSFHYQGHQCRFFCQGQDVSAPPPAPPPARPTCALPHMSRRNISGVPFEAEAKARSRDANKSTIDIENRRAIWEFE